MDTEKLTDTVNRSGFPLQIALENLIKDTEGRHGWKVTLSEHAWANPADGLSGFIDLVVENHHRTSVLVVECKRVLNASWIFIVADAKQLGRRHAKTWVTRATQDRFKHFGLKELTLEPTTPQSQFCVVDGQDAKSQPMLERVAGNVVSSIEAFATEEKEFVKAQGDMLRMYFGVIVTTAKLQVCTFERSELSLKDGTIANADFKEVPFLRFRKQLSVHQTSQPVPSIFHDFKGFAQARENTLFIVNAEALPKFLEQFEVDNHPLRDIV